MTVPIQYPSAGGWVSFVEPTVEWLELYAATGLDSVFPPDKGRRLADLLRTMAARIDNPQIETMTVDQLIAGEFPAGFLDTGDAQ